MNALDARESSAGVTPIESPVVGQAVAESTIQPADDGSATPADVIRVDESTVGTGSYVAVSCTVMMIAVTVVILGVLFAFRWLN